MMEKSRKHLGEALTRHAFLSACTPGVTHRTQHHLSRPSTNLSYGTSAKHDSFGLAQFKLVRCPPSPSTPLLPPTSIPTVKHTHTPPLPLPCGISSIMKKAERFILKPLCVLEATLSLWADYPWLYCRAIEPFPAQ